MSSRKRGIVMLPMIFGTSLSFWLHFWLLRLRGFRVRVVDVYDGQGFGRPFFLKLVRSQEAIDAHAKRFRWSITAARITWAVEDLRRAGCTNVFVVGYGLGGVFALKYEESVGDRKTGSVPVDGIVAYYPHLAFPPGFSYQPPDPEQARCPVRLLYVRNDRHVPPGTIALASRAGSNESGVLTQIYEGTDGHAFADFAVQWCFPNPLYRRRASRHAWRLMLRDFDAWSATRSAARSS